MLLVSKVSDTRKPLAFFFIMVTGIYKITNPKGKVYIGQSIDIQRRFKEYKKLRCKQQLKLYNSLLKYRPDKHSFEILELCNVRELNKKEIEWGIKFNSVENGLNLSLGSNNSIRHTSVYRKISESNKGRTAWNKGLKGLYRTEETKKKISTALTGRKHSEETKLKISKTKRNQGIQPPSQKGKKRSLETIKKMQLAQQLRRKKEKELRN